MADQRIDALDVWRAISVFLVIAFHLEAFSGIANNAPLARFVGSFGLLGVEIFFVISGYVIARGLMAEEENRGSFSIAGFYVRRFFRIFPPLIAYLGSIVLLSSLKVISFSISDLWKPLAFTCNLPVSCSWYISHTWSLAFEEQFYLVFPLFFLVFRQLRAATFTVLFALISVCTILLFLSKNEAAATSIGYFVFLDIGVCLAVFEPQLRKLSEAVTMPMTALLICLMALPQLLPVNAESTFVRFTIEPILIGAVIVATSMRTSVKHRGAILNFILTLGRASYTIYLWQQLATASYSHSIFVYFFAVVSVIAISLLSYLSFEKPLIRFGRRAAEFATLRLSRRRLIQNG